MPQRNNNLPTLPDPPPDGATLDEIDDYLDSILGTPVPLATITLNGYTFRLALPIPPVPVPTIWRITSTSPSTAVNTAVARPKLGWQWNWCYAVETVRKEIERVLSVPAP